MNTLAEIYGEFSLLSDKGTTHSYIEIYEKLLALLRDQPVTLIEIGVDRGGSIALWSRYFSNPATQIIGVDLRDVSIQVSQLTSGDPRVSTVCGDAKNPVLLNRLPSADIVIDDGSHDPHDQIVAFRNLFPRMKENGIYFIEDIADRWHVSVLLSFYRKFEIFDRRWLKNRWDDTLLLARHEDWRRSKLCGRHRRIRF